MKNSDICLETFAIRLRKLIDNATLLGTTKSEIASALEVSPNALQSYIAVEKRKTPLLANIIAIADYFKVSIDWLCGLSEKKSTGITVTKNEDIARMLVEISKRESVTIDTRVDFDNVPDWYGDRFETVVYQIVGDNNLINFVNEWKAVKALYDQKTITEEMYDAIMLSLYKKLSDETVHS